MSAVLLMLGVFSTGILTSALIGLDNPLHISVAARLIIFVGLLSGVFYTWQRCKKSCPPKHFAHPEAIKIKSYSLRFALLTLLLYSFLLERLKSDWSATTFTFEYLLALPFLLLGSPHYIRWAERRIPSGEDGYYRFGHFLSGKRKWNWSEQRDWVLPWSVKILFIPLMYSWLVTSITNLLHLNWSFHPGILISGLFMFGMSMDLLIATGGYLFSSRLLNNEVISTDRHWLGWLSCLLCYPPLVFILHTIKKQTDDIVWSQWLLSSEPLYWFWAAAITGTWLIYWTSTLHFGLRFSNLSWRGLINTGPYRYTKHPAYLSKNIYWWLHTVPFVGVASQLDLLRNLLGLSFVSLVYYLRAKTEERHLMAFPEYRAYSEYIDQRGGLARLKRLWQRASV